MAPPVLDLSSRSRGEGVSLGRLPARGDGRGTPLALGALPRRLLVLRKSTAGSPALPGLYTLYPHDNTESPIGYRDKIASFAKKHPFRLFTYILIETQKPAYSDFISTFLENFRVFVLCYF